MSFQLDRATKEYTSYLAEKVNIWDPNTLDAVQSMTARFAGMGLPDPRAAAYVALSGRIAMQALIRAFNDGFMQLTFIFLFGIALTFLIKKARPGAAAPAAAH